MTLTSPSSAQRENTRRKLRDHLKIQEQLTRHYWQLLRLYQPQDLPLAERHVNGYALFQSRVGLHPYIRLPAPSPATHLTKKGQIARPVGPPVKGAFIYHALLNNQWTPITYQHNHRHIDTLSAQNWLNPVWGLPSNQPLVTTERSHLPEILPATLPANGKNTSAFK